MILGRQVGETVLRTQRFGYTSAGAGAARVGAVGVVVVAQAPAGVWRIVRGCRCRGDGRGSAWLAADGAAACQAGGGDRRVEPAEVAAAFGVA